MVGTSAGAKCLWARAVLLVQLWLCNAILSVEAYLLSLWYPLGLVFLCSFCFLLFPSEGIPLAPLPGTWTSAAVPSRSESLPGSPARTTAGSAQQGLSLK